MKLQSIAADWEEYMPGPKEDIYALGVICLAYGQLESMFQLVFSEATRMELHQASAIFFRVPNNVRYEVLSSLMEAGSLPDVLKDLVQHFSHGFKICAENRNALMHSHSGGIHFNADAGKAGILLSRYTRAGKTEVSPATITELRKVADDIGAFVLFGAAVSAELGFHFHRIERGERSRTPPPLCDKPALPKAMNWQSYESFMAARGSRGEGG